MKKFISLLFGILLFGQVGFAADYIPKTTCVDQGSSLASCTKTFVTSIGAKEAQIWYKHSSGTTSTYKFSTSVTIPTTTSVLVDKGARLSVDSGKTLTCRVARADTGAFTGAGTVELYNDVIDAGWFLSSGQPDGTADNSAEVQKAITALPSTGGKVILPYSANSYKFNITLPDNVILEGAGPHKSVVAPYTETSPVVAVSGGRAAIRNLYFDGTDDETSDYAIRHSRAEDGAGGGLLVEDCRFKDFVVGIYINNNYYNVIQRNSFSATATCIYGRNAFNRNIIRDNKFSSFDYGIALHYYPGVDTFTTHGNTIQDNSFETPNTGGIGEYYYNSGGHLSLHNYYEGFYAAHAWPVLEAGGPIVGWHTGSGNEAYLVDAEGRDFVKLGVETGMAVANRTDGSSATVTAITNENATNDKITMTLSGGTDNDWDVDDYFLIDIDSTTEFQGGNTFQNPHFVNQSDANKYVSGVNRLASGLHGSWGTLESGNISYNKVSGQALTANTPYIVDISAQISSFTRYALGTVRLSYTFTDTSGSSGYLTIRPVGGGANDNYAYHNFAGNGYISQTIDIPLSYGHKFSIMSTRAGTLNVKLHSVMKE